MALAVDLHGGHSEEEHAQRFTALYREFSKPLIAFCNRLTGPDGDPEGLAHEAFLRAWASWDASSGRPFWPWVVTVARRLSIDHFRKVARRGHRTYAELELSNGRRFPQPEEHAEQSEEHATVRQAFAHLPPTYQRVVRMHYVDGLSYEAIAQHEGTTTESVRGMLRRARQALRAAYTKLEVGVPAVVSLAGIRRLRARFDLWAARVQVRLSAGLPELAATEAFKGAMVIAVVLATGAPLTAADHPSAGVIAGAPGSAASAEAAGGARNAAGATAGDLEGFTAADAAAWLEDGPPVPSTQLPSVLPGEEITTPEQATFTGLTPSPRAGDRTVFATGAGHTGCSVNCSVLFRSSDGGRTWRRLPALGFTDGRVLLPPAWPKDPRIFVIGARALSVSTDNGATFRRLTLAGGAAAMSPAFSSGDPHIWVGFLPGWDYDDRDGLVRPVNLSPPPTGIDNTFAFAPAWPADPRVLVGSWVPGLDPVQQGTVSLCGNGSCPAPLALPGVSGAPDVTVLPSFAASGVAFAWSGQRLYRTTDGGSSFHRLAVPVDAAITTLVGGPDDRLYLGLADLSDDDGLVGGLFVSDDRGESWHRLGKGTQLEAGVTAVTPFGTNRLLAAPQALANGGLLCSTDAGKTWASRCN